jgi:hypothetical protein
MPAAWQYRGRVISAEDIVFIQQLIREHPGASRRALSAKLCEFAASVWERGKSGGSRSVEFSEEQADAHIDIAIDFRLASGGGH